ncbi:hypothetical Protein YC6258_02798 [Gynuella sunshinyii YC6258]|uniref:Uncharacterized protein n=1 Tax=Gynuella sunshinyii YC6258 TaxID=1445510 RepID=A0A0C5VKM5_9GAMM|nr:hypothetical Protein YC6258_02798 [Gynuella sunshinyii YC6258]
MYLARFYSQPYLTAMIFKSQYFRLHLFTDNWILFGRHYTFILEVSYLYEAIIPISYVYKHAMGFMPGDRTRN